GYKKNTFSSSRSENCQTWVTDHAVMLRLLAKEGNYDNKRFFCASNSACKWGKELFEYYKAKSKKIIEI
ncbi:MAG: transcriptional regulator FilR1 domain-containing protein, partial [Methanolobus sp.]|nr:transcriptional regulator FilR1 domain-containing protein [Methanolobus sp.]